MIGYVMLGTNDPARAKAFYDPIMAQLGAKFFPGYSSDKLTFYATTPDQPMFGIGRPYDGAPATFGNGTMVSLAAPTRAAIDAIHALALAGGGKDEGAPGIRGSDPNGFYAAYFRDPDGNKLCAFRIGPP